MVKKIRLLIILCVVFCVIVIGNVVINKVSKSQAEEKESLEEVESLNAVVKICSLTDVIRIEFHNLTFVNEDDWSYSEDPSFPLDTEAIENAVTQITDLQAYRVLEDGDTLENYGLDEPAYEIKLQDKQGNQDSIKIGNAYESYYYVMVNDDDTQIYLCEFSEVSDYGKELLDYAIMDDISSLWNSTATLIEFDSDSEQIIFTKKESDDSTENSWDVAFNQEDTYEVTDTSAFDTAFTSLQLTYSACIQYQSSQDVLLDYGLDNPLYTLKIEYENEIQETEEIEIKIGSYDEINNMYYIMSSLSDRIYSVDADAVTTLVNNLSNDFIIEETTE